jgi:beta-lactamase class A
MRLLAAFFLCATIAAAQTPLQKTVRAIAAESQGKVSASCALNDSPLNCDLNPYAHPPMQSVFKFPLALTVIHQAEIGKLSLDQKVRFLPSDRILPHTHSPLQDKHPGANVDVTVIELLQLSVSDSDNVATDILLRTVGGPAAVNAYVAFLGFNGFHMEDSEAGLARDVKAQYRNWFEPAAAAAMLRRLSDNSPLSHEHTDMLLRWMENTASGRKRIAGDLPAGTVVAHKTGSSVTENGVTFATNDIGLVTLPDGRRLAIAVFVTDSKADDAARDAIIARIAKAAYDQACK